MEAGQNPQPPFPAHKKAPYNKYHVRGKDALMEAWNEETDTIDLGKLNNQFEMYSLIGYLSKIKQDAGKPSIDNYWKYGSSDNPWGDMKTYINGFNNNLKFKFKFGSKISESSINFPGLGKIITHFDKGISTYDNTSINKSKGRGFPQKGQKEGPWYHSQRAYDVAWHGVSKKGLPIDISGVATAGEDLINNASVKALQSFDMTFALELSKLVNLPQTSFNAFQSFMTLIDKTFDHIYKNDEFQEWLKVNTINLNVMKDGSINSYANLEIPFKGLFLIQLIK